MQYTRKPVMDKTNLRSSLPRPAGWKKRYELEGFCILQTKGSSFPLLAHHSVMCEHTPGALEIPLLISASTRFIYRAIWKTLAFHYEILWSLSELFHKPNSLKTPTPTEIVNYHQASGLFLVYFRSIDRTVKTAILMPK